MLALFGEKIFMICCLSKKLDEKQNKALFLDHPVITASKKIKISGTRNSNLFSC